MQRIQRKPSETGTGEVVHVFKCTNWILVVNAESHFSSAGYDTVFYVSRHRKRDWAGLNFFFSVPFLVFATKTTSLDHVHPLWLGRIYALLALQLELAMVSIVQCTLFVATAM